eukprot:6462238-Amphidinium_carterae.1
MNFNPYKLSSLNGTLASLCVHASSADTEICYECQALQSREGADSDLETSRALLARASTHGHMKNYDQQPVKERNQMVRAKHLFRLQLTLALLQCGWRRMNKAITESIAAMSRELP